MPHIFQDFLSSTHTVTKWERLLRVSIIYKPHCTKIVLIFIKKYGKCRTGWKIWKGFKSLILKVKRETRPEIKTLCFLYFPIWKSSCRRFDSVPGHHKNHRVTSLLVTLFYSTVLRLYVLCPGGPLPTPRSVFPEFFIYCPGVWYEPFKLRPEEAAVVKHPCVNELVDDDVVH